MGIIGFSVFRSKIEDGSKSHTIRFRKNPPKVGESLSLWWKPRSGNGELIGYTVCTRVDEIEIINGSNVILNGERLTKEQIEKLAIADGFDSVADFCEFFLERIGKGQLIHWNPDLKKTKPEES